MANIFEIVEIREGEKTRPTEVRLGVRLRIADQDSICPVTGTFHHYNMLEKWVIHLKNHLDDILTRARQVLEVLPETNDFEITDDMDPEQIWSVLSGIKDEATFISRFNHINEGQRRGVAEHVLTKCNIFTGKAALFSSQYDNESGLLK